MNYNIYSLLSSGFSIFTQKRWHRSENKNMGFHEKGRRRTYVWVNGRCKEQRASPKQRIRCFASSCFVSERERELCFFSQRMCVTEMAFLAWDRRRFSRQDRTNFSSLFILIAPIPPFTFREFSLCPLKFK